MSEPVVYQSAFESLARAVQLDQKPELIEALKTLGYDRRNELTHYSPNVLRAVLDHLVTVCFPDMAPDEGYLAFGRKAFLAYRSTLVGQVAMAALSMMGVERALKLAVRAFRTVSNFSQHEVLKLEDRALLYRVHRTTLPVPYLQGLLEELLVGSRHGDVKLTLSDRTAEQVDYKLTW
jgi:uncharacterized protein (TIGR02265 family)